MKNYKMRVIILAILIGTFQSNAQIKSSETVQNTLQNSLAFLDGTSSPTYNAANANYVASGILFPRMDLTLTFHETYSGMTGPWDAAALTGSTTYIPNYYDGLVVFNTGTGTIDAYGMGTVGTAVVPGFYYYRNTTTDWDGGTWTSMASTAPASVISTSATDTNLTNSNGKDELVIGLPGTANGTTTVMDLGTTNINADTVDQFRKAYIYDSEGGKLLMIATGTYTSLTNIFVTGNGMMNELLPASTSYYVELYYTAK